MTEPLPDIDFPQVAEQPHVLLVSTLGKKRYVIECPGLVAGRCEGWIPCDRPDCDVADQLDALDLEAAIYVGEVEAHGEAHRDYDDIPHVASGRCWVLDRPEQYKKAAEAAGLTADGRHLVWPTIEAQFETHLEFGVAT